MPEVKDMSKLLKDVVLKQKKARDVTANIIEKQEKIRKKAQIKPTEQKLGGV